jgi:hypothetical protein
MVFLSFGDMGMLFSVSGPYIPEKDPFWMYFAVVAPSP